MCLCGRNQTDNWHAIYQKRVLSIISKILVHTYKYGDKYRISPWYCVNLPSPRVPQAIDANVVATDYVLAYTLPLVLAAFL